MNNKHVKFSYSQAIQLANWSIDIFYNEEAVHGFIFKDFWEELKEEIIPRLFKPHKKTILHYYLEYVDGFVEHDLRSTLKNLSISEYESYIYYEIKFIEGAGIDLSDVDLDFEAISNCNHCKSCISCIQFENFIDTIHGIQEEIKPIAINSSFHLLMLNKSFLRDFHEEIANHLVDEKEDLNVDYPEGFKKGNKVKRNRWPAWLKKGLFYRDNGVCVVCRCDMTGVINRGGDFEIDHIVPISNYGSNDPSNLQILCKDCNLKKLNKSSLISVYSVPLWNI
ncbi:hypothetical protein CDO73_17125 [Saccharibacillus sp. O23]|uniref:HNH endonuclease n=1 Tax=Saccharibacillus sp. O23 TaxID=2009338 RepID=UPI000B4E211D|nr:HNH endonuclease [Saccharibacillus sp. O23]OWR28930.1 hypothetical protein CDO73_17125 [Saccharibacillus sp. O23]